LKIGVIQIKAKNVNTAEIIRKINKTELFINEDGEN